jgi:hypothetical protein
MVRTITNLDASFTKIQVIFDYCAERMDTSDDFFVQYCTLSLAATGKHFWSLLIMNTLKLQHVLRIMKDPSIFTAGAVAGAAIVLSMFASEVTWPTAKMITSTSTKSALKRKPGSLIYWQSKSCQID